MAQVDIPVNAPSGPYSIVVGDGVAATIAQRLRMLDPSGVMLVSDSNVMPIYGDAVAAELRQVAPLKMMSVPAGEKSKSLDQLTRLYDIALAEPALDRNAVVIALGGGVVGDLAGFMAATLMRGVRLVQVPTSLMAMLDSSVGGKTAINHQRGKNLIGSFHQPAAVICDLNLLKTLPDREFRSALSEAVKCAVLGQPQLLAWLENAVDLVIKRDVVALRHCVGACVQFKAGVVERDENETGKERILLNLGHTLGHALETLLPDKLLHGEAVAIGLSAAMRVSARHAGLPAPAVKRVEALLKKCGFDTSIPTGMDDEALMKVMAADKKRTGPATIKYVLTPRLGHAVAMDLKLDAQLLKDMRGA